MLKYSKHALLYKAKEKIYPKIEQSFYLDSLIIRCKIKRKKTFHPVGVLSPMLSSTRGHTMARKNNYKLLLEHYIMDNLTAESSPDYEDYKYFTWGNITANSLIKWATKYDKLRLLGYGALCSKRGAEQWLDYENDQIVYSDNCNMRYAKLLALMVVWSKLGIIQPDNGSLRISKLNACSIVHKLLNEGHYNCLWQVNGIDGVYNLYVMP
jgi:hypothetical protein